MSTPRFVRIALLAAAMAWGASSVYAGCGKCAAHGGGSGTKGSAAKEGKSVESKGSGGKDASAACAAACAAKAARGCSADACVAGKKACISPHGLSALLGAGQKVTVLDARGGKDDGRSVPGAKRVNAASTDKEIAKAAPSKDGLIVTYCGNIKCGASNKLATRLKKLGYKNIIEMPAGIDGWVAAGLSAK